MMNGHGLPTWAACALLLTLFAFALGQPVSAAAPAGSTSTNFLVRMTGEEQTDDSLAGQVAQQAEKLRRELAIDWLGSELPTAQKRSLISIKLNSAVSLGRTLPTRQPGGHLVWIEGSRQESLGPLLAHEILHTVIADRFGKEFPVWANEGLASRYDSLDRKQIRERILADQINERLWPNLAEILESEIRTQAQYAVAASLAQFLLERSSPADFLQFAVAGNSHGWNAALQSYYAIANTQQLQQQWQRWLVEKINSPRIAKIDFENR